MSTAYTHPLDPLTHAEMAQAIQLMQEDDRIDKGIRFMTVDLKEPAKDLLKKISLEAIPRRAFAVLLDNRDGATYEVVVSLTDKRVETIQHIPGVQPLIAGDEIEECQEIVLAHPEVQAALAKRGINDLTWVEVAPLSAGSFDDGLPAGTRYLRTILQNREHEDDNGDGHPIDGLHVLVDLNNMSVIRVEDREVKPVPAERADYAADKVANLRTDIKPLDISQPEGVSFTVEGWQVRWQNFSFRVGFNHREGLTLHEIRYNDEGSERPLIYRASMAEMVVPYGDSDISQYRKNFFDAGEYGMGATTNSLELGCDCLGEIYYFDGHICSSRGGIRTVKNAICLHEEDFSLLWKHKGEVRRSRRLVISFIATVGNYDYGFYWYFYQDGAIHFEVKLTGIVAAGALHPGTDTPYGTKINDSLYLPNHQHFFCVRLDTEFDGLQNSVLEVDTVADPVGESNPFGNAFYARKTVLESEQVARRLIDPFKARYWQIANLNSHNKTGQPVGYKLLPGDNCLPFSQPGSELAKRAGFLWHHLWVTPYAEDEIFPAGTYPNQHPGGDGLPRWTAADRSVKDRDIVVWYVMGNTHLPDWRNGPLCRWRP